MGLLAFPPRGLGEPNGRQRFACRDWLSDLLQESDSDARVDRVVDLLSPRPEPRGNCADGHGVALSHVAVGAGGHRRLFGSNRQLRRVVEHRDVAAVGGGDIDEQGAIRVQGKFVEQALFWYLAEAAGHAPVGRVVVNFKRTDRNAAAHKVLTTLGFEERDGVYARDIVPGQFRVDFLAVNADAQDIAA